MTTTENGRKLTRRVLKVLHIAHQEAVRMGQNAIGTEHILLGLLREHGGLAVHILHELGVSDEQLYRGLERQLGYPVRAEAVPQHSLWQRLIHRFVRRNRSNAVYVQLKADGWDAMGFAVAAKSSMTLASQEAEKLHHNFVGTEHLLYALADERSGLAATILRESGVDMQKVEAYIQRLE